MAFEIKDTFQSYVKRGDHRGLFNVSRNDSSAQPKYYAYQNDEGAYFIQRITTSGTLKIYEYYGRKDKDTFATDWTNRANLTYGEYYELFKQG